MKQKDMLLLGGAAALAYYFFIYKKKAATQTQAELGGGGSFDLGAIFDALTGTLNNAVGALGQVLTPYSPPSTLQQQAQALATSRMPAQIEARWTAPSSPTPSTLAGITSYGAYNPAAIQAAPTAALTDMGAAVSQIADFAKASGGSVGTAYSAGGAIPVAVVPQRAGGVGLWTTIEAYTAQATGKAPTAATVATVPAAAALSPAQRLARGLM